MRRKLSFSGNTVFKDHLCFVNIPMDLEKSFPLVIVLGSKENLIPYIKWQFS